MQFDIIQVQFLLGDFMTIYLYSYMHRTFYKQKRPYIEEHKNVEILVYVVAYLVLLTANAMPFAIFNLLSMILCYIVPLYLCYKVNNIKKLTYFAFYAVGTMIAEMIVAVFAGIFKNGMGFETQYEVLTPALSVIMNLTELIITMCICKFGSKEKDETIKRVTGLFFLLPFVSLGYIVTEHIVIALGIHQNFNVDQYLQMVIAIFMVNIVVFIILEKYTELMKKDIRLNDEKVRLESEAQMMEYATAVMKERLATNDEAMQRDRILRHDRRHFEAMLLGLLEEGDYEEAKRLLSMSLETKQQVTKKICDNHVVNAAITHYVSQAKKENTRIEMDVHIPADSLSYEIELAIVISNLLENAINACRGLPEEKRFVKMSAKYKEQLILEIENSFDGEVTLDENGFPYTEKKHHGIGTKSVYSFVRKMEGEIFYSVKDGIFVVRMIV